MSPAEVRYWIPEMTNAMTHKAEKRPMIQENKLLRIFAIGVSGSPVSVGKHIPPIVSPEQVEAVGVLLGVFGYADGTSGEFGRLFPAPLEVSAHTPALLHWPVFPPGREQL